jgi:hypothetical protein
MEKMIAKCGNRCDLCPAYYKNIDSFDKQKISDGWFKYHGFRKPADNIGCVGCLNEGKHDRENCPIKECADKRNLENCGHCADLICDLLKHDMDIIEGAVKKHKNISKNDYNNFLRPYKNRDILIEIHGGLKNK